MSTKAKKVKERSWKSEEHKLVLIILSVIFGLYSLTLIYPLIWIVINSFKLPVDFQFEPNSFLVKNIYFGNYVKMFSEFNFVPMLSNSLLLSLIIPTTQMISCCCISYAVTKFKFKGRMLVYFIGISVMFIPSVGSLAATYEVMTTLHLMDTHIGLIILCSNGLGLSFLLVSSQYRNISNEYAEAAAIDGASKARIFFQIITPQIAPTLLALWLLSFISSWNDYAMPFLFLKSYKTLAVGIKELNEAAVLSGGADYPVLFSGIVMVEVPIFILFLVFQKRILNISLGGGIKG